MRIALTGGAGFLGSHLCDFLITKGHRVTAIDNLITGKRGNIAHLLDNTNFRFIEQDVTEYINISTSIDFVLHFASPASPKDYLRFPIQTLKVGALGTHNALGLARAKSAKFLLASTSEVYGDPEVHPQRETYWGRVNPIGPRSAYDEAKRFAEALVMAYHRCHGINTRIVRIFNTYGPRMAIDDGRVVSNFIVQALTGAPLTVYGNGSQTRSLCYVSDMLDGIYKLMLSDIVEPVNIGNSQEISILEFAKLILEITNNNTQIIFKVLPTDDPKKRRPDITQAKALLNWNPKVSLKNGITETVNWFKVQLRIK